MLLTITSIELKSPAKFFALSAKATHILKQLKTTNCAGMKKRGFWTKHYTMTLWNNEEEMRDFATSGAHLEAIKMNKNIAKEIRTYTYSTNQFPNWKAAKSLLQEKGKTITF